MNTDLVRDIMKNNNKIYLGDSVYVEFSGYDFTVTTENGFGASNEIIMDFEIINLLNNKKKKKRARND